MIADPTWVEAVYTELMAAWAARNSELPSNLQSVQRNLADLDARITRLVDSIEDGRHAPDIQERLACRRAERAELLLELQKLQRLAEADIPQPDRNWLIAHLQQLGETLNGATPAATLALRDLVGGAIIVHEIRVPGQYRGFLRAIIRIDRTKLAHGIIGQGGIARGDEVECAIDEFTVDIVRDQRPADKRALAAKALQEAGLSWAEIGVELTCSANHVRRLLRRAAEILGVEIPDGRAVYRRRMRELDAADEAADTAPDEQEQKGGQPGSDQDSAEPSR